jgi:beta-lactamase regulating signal transducer with metallopeptidase domain
MLEFLQPGTSLSWDLLWQSSLFLTAGLAASQALQKTPARAHRLLLLAILAALLTPLLSQGIHKSGWGILRSAEPALPPAEGPVILTHGFQAPPVTPAVGSIPVRPRPVDPSLARAATNEAAPAPPVLMANSLVPSWKQIALGSWMLLSGLAIVRLASSFGRGLRMIRGSEPVVDATLLQAASRASNRLSLGADPVLRASSHIRCPSIWCWGRRPILLVPAAVSAIEKPIDWVAVFCHELAHCRRLDHVSALACQVLVCVLPWNPLAWWARARLAQLAELACDDWVLASGMQGTEYASSLLELLPQRGASAALAAVSSRSGLVGRMKHILGDRPSSPLIGRGWALLALALTLLSASALALSQAGSARKRDPDGQGAASPPANQPPRKEPAGTKSTVHVTVQGPGGKPVASATVLWLGSSKPALGVSALPHDSPERNAQRSKVLAKAQTDEEGRAEMRAEFGPSAAPYSSLVVKYPGFGIDSRSLLNIPKEPEVKFTLSPEVLIHGRLLTPAGTPAAGVRVLLNGFHNDTKRDEYEGMYVGLARTDDELPGYWPRSLTTDADGRFTLGGVPPEVYASLSFSHPDYAVDEVTVSTVADGSISPGLRAFEIVPVKPTFTHTLEPARPVQGRVTDKETGKPLAGISVEMIPMRRHGGMPFPGKTDADGRFRISGHQTEFMYITSVYPRADSGYLATSQTHQGWPAGAKFLEVNLALDKGRMTSGRVIDRDTKLPVQSAAVMYQAARNNPNNKNQYDLRNTVLTDREGKFTITGLPGDGMLLVEAPDPDVLRTPLQGTMFNRSSYPHGSITVNIPKEGEPKPVEITVRKGVTIEARVVDATGAVVPDVVAFYPGISACLIDVWNQGQEFPDGIVRIRGADPEKTYRVWFIQPDRKLGTTAELKYNGNAAGPVEVRLQPTASVHGKVAGAMPEACQVYASLVLDKDRKSLSDRDLFNEDLAEIYANIVGQRHMNLLNEHPRSTGEFTLETMIPGSSFYLTAAEGSGRSAHAAVLDLKAGENRDLGTLVLKERKP